MGKNYDEIKDFELNLQIRSYKYFDKQVALFEEMMELFLEPLHEVTSSWHYKEEKSPLMLVLARMFNDYESSRLLLLNGFPEQAVMPMRDSIECMMLFRLFSKDSKYALRWPEFIKEYKASIIKASLDDLKIDCPEYAFYGMLSEMVHPNLLSVASRVTEHKLDNENTIRSFHFGGMNRPTWTQTVFNNLLVLMLMTLLSVLPPTYSILIQKPEEWWNKVISVRDKLEKFGTKVQLKEGEETIQEKNIRKRVYKKSKIWRIEAELKQLDDKRIKEDKGFTIT